MSTMRPSRGYAFGPRPLHCSAAAASSTSSSSSGSVAGGSQHAALVRQRTALRQAAMVAERRNADTHFRNAMDAFLSTTLNTLKLDASALARPSNAKSGNCDGGSNANGAGTRAQITLTRASTMLVPAADMPPAESEPSLVQLLRAIDLEPYALPIGRLLAPDISALIRALEQDRGGGGGGGGGGSFNADARRRLTAMGMDFVRTQRLGRAAEELRDIRIAQARARAAARRTSPLGQLLHAAGAEEYGDQIETHIADGLDDLLGELARCPSGASLREDLGSLTPPMPAAVAERLVAALAVVHNRETEAKSRAAHVRRKRTAAANRWKRAGRAAGKMAFATSAVVSFDGKAHDLEVLDALAKFVDSDRERFATAFAATDKDGSGQLDAVELGAFLRAQALHLGETEVKRLFKMLDADGSGEIGLEELVAGVAAARTAHFASLGIPEQPPKPFPPRPPPDTGDGDDLADDSDDDTDDE